MKTEGLKRVDPTPETVQHALPSGATGTFMWPVTIKATFDMKTGTTSTADVGMFSWINPEPGTILVTEVTVVHKTTGTGGTFDMGISDDGTGSSDIIFNGATTDPGAGVAQIMVVRGVGTTAQGTIGGTAWLVGPGGTGTSNSIVAKQSELTSTAEGYVYITYMPI